MRSISIFGATGSIGENTLDLIGRAPQDYRIVALSGGRNIARLAEQARIFRPDLVVTAFDSEYEALNSALAGSGIAVAAGAQALREAAARPADWTMNAVIGAAGLVPSFETVARGGALALANKESLVCAGPLLLALAAKTGANVLPVDSEHSAVFQALCGSHLREVEAITLTASGGAFRDWPIERLAQATVAEASTHPNFAMGQRITIDSATMFNKAMEVIEAKELFGLAPEQVEVVIQREQIIHALVAFRDGAVMAHMGMPDMRHAIGYALHYPERLDLPVARLDLKSLGKLSFEPACETRYPALRLAQDVMRAGGYAGAVFNAAKETALDQFIAGRIGFMDMAGLVEDTLEAMAGRIGFGNSPESLGDVIEMDAAARAIARGLVLGARRAERA